jgi:hypothetical protein
MKAQSRDLERRYESAKQRIEALTSLRKLVSLPPAKDIKARQWHVIESQLQVAENKLLARLKSAARAYLPLAHEIEAARKLNALLGDLELELSTAFGFFDTYMDVLTQRHAPTLGRLLAGCDALAWEAIHRDHPALQIVEPPLVYCDRGFGASTLREGVRIRRDFLNPMPLIQLPYSRLEEKCNLTSVLHEVGHEALVRLDLVAVLPKAFRDGLSRAGASRLLRDLCALWSSEIGPDFWTFCVAGLASAGAIREILALAPEHAFRITAMDPHPPPYVRVLLSFECCRQTWGRGVWDRWEADWRDLYPMPAAPASSRRLIEEALQALPLLARILLRTRFRVLNGRSIPQLFDLEGLNPQKLQGLTGSVGSPQFQALTFGEQLAVFRLLKDKGNITEERLDRVMTQWLLQLGQRDREVEETAVS